MRINFVNGSNRNMQQTYNRRTEMRMIKMLEKRIQNKPSNACRMEGPLAIIRSNTRNVKMAG